MKIITFIFFIFISYFAIGQDIEYAKSVISDLTSSYYKGRGYSFNGDLKAANFIKEELKKNKVKALARNYFQYFNISTNTFSANLEVELDGKLLIPMSDYLVKPYSNSCKGKYAIAYLDSSIINKDSLFYTFLKQNYSNQFVFIDTTGTTKDKQKNVSILVQSNSLNAKGFIGFSEKLIYSASSEQRNYCHIILSKQFANSKPSHIYVNIKNKFKKSYKTQNVIGFTKGKSDTAIVICAHYDHLGTMGKNIYFPGANDNCSGVSITMDLAKSFSQKIPRYSIIYILFSSEEIGLLGSKYFVENPLYDLSKIKFVFNLDMVGTGDDGICIVNGSVLEKEFNLLNNIVKENNLFAEVKKRGEAANSDHYYFYKNGIKSIFIYTTGGVSEYHNTKDIASTLPLTKYNELFTLITQFIELYE